MKISVVIPLFNKARHIQRAIRSVLAQTWQDFELIVVDDGSTDGSGEVVRQIGDPRIRLIVQDNAGVSAARNRGIQEATADLVAFLDADDEWLPCFLGTVMELRVRYPEAGMYATAYRYSQGGTTWQPAFANCRTSPQGGLLDDYFHAAMATPPVCSSVVMIPKRILAEAGNFPMGIKRGEDLQTWAWIALRYRVAWSPNACAIYHLSADNRACNMDWVTADMAAAPMIEEFLRSGIEPVSSRRMIEEYLVSQRLPILINCYLRGKRGWALGILRKMRETSIFRRKRLLVFWCVLCVPSWIARCALALKARLRRATRPLHQ